MAYCAYTKTYEDEDFLVVRYSYNSYDYDGKITIKKSRYLNYDTDITKVLCDGDNGIYAYAVIDKLKNKIESETPILTKDVIYL